MENNRNYYYFTIYTKKKQEEKKQPPFISQKQKEWTLNSAAQLVLIYWIRLGEEKKKTKKLNKF
jgi:hypothetical protein